MHVCLGKAFVSRIANAAEGQNQSNYKATKGKNFFFLFFFEEKEKSKAWGKVGRGAGGNRETR